MSFFWQISAYLYFSSLFE